MKKSKRRGYAELMERLSGNQQGRKALALFRKFWGIRTATEIKTMGRGKLKVMVGLGRCPAITLADGPKGKARHKRRIKLKGLLACDPSGRQMVIYGAKNKRLKRGFLGYVASTEYIPTKAIEMAGSVKSGKHWVHRHDDDGGHYPKANLDGSGNIVYSRGSYRISDWIYR
jgi:hypothetical protein